MSLIELYLRKPNVYFYGKVQEPQEAEYLIVGCPYDSTVSRRPGTRFGPFAIRWASLEIESFSLRKLKDFEDIKVADLGDLIPTYSSIEDYLNRLERVLSEIKREYSKARVFVIGGEHTVSYACIKALDKSTGVIIFDAHMDLRQEYPYGNPWTHATVSRRICEYLGPEAVLLVGVRAFCKEEYEYARGHKINFISALSIKKNPADSLKNILEWLSSQKYCYLSIDMDVIDPSQAPGVSTPEPEGITVSTLLDLLYNISEYKEIFRGFDLVEVSPPYDPSEITSSAAAKIIMEVMTYFSAKN